MKRMTWLGVGTCLIAGCLGAAAQLGRQCATEDPQRCAGVDETREEPHVARKD